MCHNSSACHAYLMWAELDQYFMCVSHFLHVSPISNTVTMEMGTKLF